MLFSHKDNFLLSFFVFLNAFLFFLLEIYLGKYFLPYFGGSASVWNVCLAFFTTILFASYLYSSFISKFKPKIMLIINLALGILSLLIGLYGYFFSGWITPFTINIPGTLLNNPVANLLSLLILSTSIVFIFLGGTNIICQNLYYRIYKREPYHLYIISNLGSFVGLASFPLFFERFFSVNEVGFIFSIILAFSLIIFLLIILRSWQNLLQTSNVQKKSLDFGISIKLKWITISFVTNALLISATNYISQEIFPFPMLWAVILSSYLLSFTLGFRKLNSTYIQLASLFSVISLLVALNFIGTTTFLFLITLFLFSTFIVLNNSLYNLRPEPEHLNSFYLYMVIGGALGSLLITIIPPLIFNDYYEIPILFGITSIFASKNLFKKICLESINLSTLRAISFNYIFLILLGFLLYQLFGPFIFTNATVVNNTRNFYGILKVKESINNTRVQINGTTIHGLQKRDSVEATTYYWVETPIGKTINYMQTNSDSLNIAAIGLGVGTISSYCRETDQITYYELNHNVIESAKKDFTFLKNCKNTSIYEGDARINMIKHSLEKKEKFDLIIVDAFTGDAIPYHLITAEAGTLYKSLLKDNGIIAFHISNKYLKLEPVIKGTATKNNMHIALLENNGKGEDAVYLTSLWGIASNNESLLNYLNEFYKNSDKGKIVSTDRSLDWTDNKNNLLDVLHLRLKR